MTLLNLRFRQVALVLVVVLVMITTFKCKAQTQKPRRTDRCGLYMAESTIPGAGMGLFVGHTSFEPGEVVSNSDLVVPVFDLQWRDYFWSYDFLLNDYVWSPSSFPSIFQGTEKEDMVAGYMFFAFSPGLGAIPNFRLNMVNVEDPEQSTLTMGMSGVSSASPGAGAFTPYYGRKFQATQPIPPGMELSMSYDDDFFSTRPDDYPTMPLIENYGIADDLLKIFLVLKLRIAALQNPDSNVSEALYHLMVHDFPYKSRTMYAMPLNVSIIDHLLMTGGTANTAYNESIRSLEWLEENGSCMDNIKDGVSTIPHAGRGAFANRFIPQGELVAPMPLIHIGNRNILAMYKASKNQANKGGYTVRAPTQPAVHQHLLLNYCFGHKETELLLCPYGVLTSLINHSHDQPNAILQWSKNLRHPEWLTQMHFSWDHMNHPGLSFDVIALRDIEEDEEILIDYGIEWETAWREHVTNFDPPRRNYTPAFEMNQQVDFQIKTIYEADYETIDGIFTSCRKHMVDMALGQKDALRGVNDMRMRTVVDEDVRGSYPCRVVRRNHDDSYIAELFSRVHKEHPSGMWEINVDIVKYVLFDVPRDTFYFHDNYYHRDHNQEWSFRHDMRIPDGILPDAWRLHSGQESGTTSSEPESPKTVETSTTWNESDSNDLQRLVTKGKKQANNNDQGAAWHNGL